MNTLKTLTVIATLFLTLCALSFHTIYAAETTDSGISKRVPWTSSRILGSPDPPLPYITERAFPNLGFRRCLDITDAPGTDRLFVAEQSGKIFSFVPDSNVTKADLLVDMKRIRGVQNVYALTFHPDFANNRFCYICYIKAPGRDDGTHVARFEVSRTDPPTIDLSTERTIITWLSGGHNGCCLKFGPDGYLYISTGDAEGPNPPDIRRTGQDVTDLLSCILRIDVDQSEDGKNYRIPPDNPFVEMADARDEIWAYGLRNPWRMSFDRMTGDLWVGDVGWEMWEMLNRIERGGNYGWAVMEGNQSANAEWPRGPTPILPPTIEHPHSESSSITDGLTYYGSRLKDLYGTHIYGDYDTGKIWGFRFENEQVVGLRELADSTHRIVGFGEDSTGELYLLDHIGGTVHRLVPNPHEDNSADFPRKLSETGLFRSASDHKMAAGVVPYSIHAELWADGAKADRFVAIPNSESIRPKRSGWEFPKDSVLVKTLSLEMVTGKTESERRIETQILHFDGADWRAYAYEWNEDQTDATLVASGGKERMFEVKDSLSPDGLRIHRWQFTGRAECLRCHSRWSGPVLGFNTPQLNRKHQYDGLLASQLETMSHTGILSRRIQGDSVPKFADPYDKSADLNLRARSYLHVNCAHCHRPNAGSAIMSKMNYDMPLEKAALVDVRPTQGTFGIHSANVVSPGDPFRSVLLYRMSKIGGGRMPHVGSHEVDLQGIDLIHDWIGSLKVPNENELIASRRQNEAKIIKQLATTERASEITELLDTLLTSTSGAQRLLRSVTKKTLPASTTKLVVERATQHENIAVRDLFERFLPPSRRVKRLGTVVRPHEILAMLGDANKGRELFFNTAGVQCKNCHQINKMGIELGPDLTTIGTKLNRAQILDSILNPSKLIDPKYVTHMIETGDGRILTGLLVEKTDNQVVLKDSQNKLLTIALDNIEQFVPQPKSLMPELQLRDLTAEQVADLLEYLCTRK